MFPPWFLLLSVLVATLIGCRKTKKTQNQMESSVCLLFTIVSHCLLLIITIVYFQKCQKPKEEPKNTVATPSSVVKPDVSLTMTAVLTTEARKTEKELEFGTCPASEKEPEKTDLSSVDETHNPLLDKEVQSRLMLLSRTRSQADLEQCLPVQKTQQDDSTKTAKKMLPVCERSEHVVTAMRSKRGEMGSEKAVGGARIPSQDSTNQENL